MLRSLLKEQRRAVDFFYDQLSISDVEQGLQYLLATEGTIYFSGIGKSAYIAQKIAATLISTGTRAAFLSAVDALHGDIGILTPKDTLIFLSKTGETQELIEMVPLVRAKGLPILVVTSQMKSKLAGLADYTITLPCQGELCPFDLAPTTSTVLQLLLGDLWTGALMRHRSFTLEAYAANHPKGQIGKRASLKVKDLMLSLDQTPTCSPDHTLQDVLVEFSEKRCGCILIVDPIKRLRGIFTDGDLRRALQTKQEQVLRSPLSSLMTAQPKVISQEASAWEAVRLMESDTEHPIMVLPVVENHEVVGLVKMHDLIQAGLHVAT